jgi:RNase P subunit RPR2
MPKFKYITKRTLHNKNGEDRGKILVVVRINSEDAEVDYTCPECQHSSHVIQRWKRPFSVKCEKCGFLMRLPRLKGKNDI